MLLLLFQHADATNLLAVVDQVAMLLAATDRNSHYWIACEAIVWHVTVTEKLSVFATTVVIHHALRNQSIVVVVAASTSSKRLLAAAVTPAVAAK
jgi:hypothetical protein